MPITAARADSMPKTTAVRDAVNAMLKVQEDVCRLENAVNTAIAYLANADKLDSPEHAIAMALSALQSAN